MTLFNRPQFHKPRGKVHELVGGALESTPHGVLARCVCGWSSGYRPTSLIASAAFCEHLEDPHD
jgi:hypothetical protein